MGDTVSALNETDTPLKGKKKKDKKKRKDKGKGKDDMLSAGPLEVESRNGPNPELDE